MMKAGRDRMENEDCVMIKGTLMSGKGEGKYFTQLPWAKKQFIDKLGFDPYPGTLNLKLENAEDLERFRLLKNKPGIEIKPGSGDYCVGFCFKALIESKIEGAVVIPKVKSYEPDLLEIISPINLRTSLNLWDGDIVKIKIQSTKQHLDINREIVIISGPEEEKSTELQAVLFDFDGTLVDSLKALNTAFNEGVSSLGLNPISIEKLASMLSAGLDVRQMLLKTYPSKFRGQENLMSECTDAIRNSYRIQEKRIQLIPGTVEIIRWLSEKGIRIAIVTGMMIPTEEMKKKLQLYGVDVFIEKIITGKDVPRRKPAPDLIIEALKRLDLSPQNTLVVGDSIVDVKAGKAAGTWTAAVLSGGEKKTKLKKERPDFLIESVKDLSNILKLNMNPQT